MRHRTNSATVSAVRYAVGAMIGTLVSLILTTRAPADFRVVARTGDTAPNSTFAFSELYSPVLNGNGEVAFAAFLDDENFTSGLWSEGDGIGSLRNVALVGDTAPDTGGATYSDFDDTDRYLHLNDLGDVAFVSRLDDDRFGVFSDRERPTNDLIKVALEGEQAPGTLAGRNFRFGFNLQAMGRIHSGVAFYSSLTPAPAPNNFGSSGVFSEGFAVILDKIAEFAEPAPGTVRPSIGGGLAQFTQLFAPTINDSGYVSFGGETNAGSGAGSIGAAGIWSNSPGGTLRPVALAGQTAPGTALAFSIFFANLSPSFTSTPFINNDGDISFGATLVGGNYGIWVERDGSIDKIALQSEPAPGTTSNISKIDSDVLLDDAGLAVFHAELDDGRDGLWKESSPGVLAPVAIQGQNAPGTSLQFLNILDYAINRPGQLAFKAQLSDIGSDGVFVTDSTGIPQKVVARGDILDINGVEAEVETIEFLGINRLINANAAGTTNSFNDLGQVAVIVEAMDVQTSEFFSSLLVFDAPTPMLLPGDYNQNGTVDAADYAVWRNSEGTTNSLPNDPLGGTIGVAQYNQWRYHFGQTAGSGALTKSAVPEPAAALLLVSLVAIGTWMRGPIPNRFIGSLALDARPR